MGTDPPTPLPPTRRCTPPGRPAEADQPSWMPTIPSPASAPFSPTGTPIHTVSPLLLLLADESKPEIAEIVAHVRANAMVDARTALSAVKALGHGLSVAGVTVPAEGKREPLAGDQREMLERMLFFLVHALGE